MSVDTLPGIAQYLMPPTKPERFRAYLRLSAQFLVAAASLDPEDQLPSPPPPPSASHHHHKRLLTVSMWPRQLHGPFCSPRAKSKFVVAVPLATYSHSLLQKLHETKWKRSEIRKTTLI